MTRAAERPMTLQPSLDRLEAMAKRILPARVVAACGSPAGDIGELFPQELLSIENAVPRRKAEFAAGRAAARAALARLGVAPIPISVGYGRAPNWPPGFVGSISHCRSAVIAIASRRTEFIGDLGIDVEDNLPLEPDLWSGICTDAELKWLEQRDDPGQWAMRMFSIKEAVFKAQYPSTGLLLSFTDVEITDLDTPGKFVARLEHSDQKVASGRYQSNDQFVLSFAASN